MKKFPFIFFLILFSVSAKAGEKVCINGIYYYLNDYVTQEHPQPSAYVTFKDIEKKVVSYYSGNVVIPSTITYGGKSYVVDCIGAKAFENSIKLRSIKLPLGIKVIESYAF